MTRQPDVLPFSKLFRINCWMFLPTFYKFISLHPQEGNRDT